MSNDDAANLSRRLRWDQDRRPATAPGGGGRRYANVPGAEERWDDDDKLILTTAASSSVSFEQRQLDRIEDEALDRRRQLWRDTAVILSAVVAGLLVANIVFPSLTGTVIASPTPNPTEVTLGPTGSPGGVPGLTGEPILDPSLGIDATPTPAPARTLPPTGTAAPTRPGSTFVPIATPRPTPTSKATPTPAPTPTPTPTPEITPVPAPTVHVSCTALPALMVSCTRTGTDVAAGSDVWDMGGSGTVVSGGNGSDSITFTYDAEGTYHVVVTITGLDGSSASDGTDVTASAL